MDVDEAKAIAGIVGTADNECSVCVGDLLEKLQAKFPSFDWEALEQAETSARHAWEQEECPKCNDARRYCYCTPESSDG